MEGDKEALETEWSLFMFTGPTISGYMLTQMANSLAFSSNLYAFGFVC
jgi:hypothetical protein